MQGKFFVFEGLDGGGKSEQAKILVTNLNRIFGPTIQVREPGGTPIAEQIRSVVKGNSDNTEEKFTVESETLLMFAARAQLVPYVRAQLAAGVNVVADRWDFSTRAFQCGGKGFPLEHFYALRKMLNLDTLVPDMIFYGSNSGKVKEPEDRIEFEYFEVRGKIGEEYDRMFALSNMDHTVAKSLVTFDINGVSIEDTAEMILMCARKAFGAV